MSERHVPASLMTKAWGCPACKSRESKVDDVDRDGDGYVVRLRKCSRCGESWSTQEVPLGDRHAFFARAEHRLDVDWYRRHRRVARCRFCGGRYQEGSWSRHCRTPEHRAFIAQPLSDERLAARAAVQRERYWQRHHGIPAPPDYSYARRGKGPSGRKIA